MVTTKSYYERNKEAIRAYQARYRATSTKWRMCNKLWNEANPEKQKSYRAKYNASVKGKFTKLKLRAKAANIPIDIKMDDFIEWCKRPELKCFYCGRGISFAPQQKRLDNLSIDRRDNNKGYALENIVLSCNRCNLIKGSWFTEGQMLEIAHKYFTSGLSGR